MLDAKQQIEILEDMKHYVDRIHDAQLFAKEHPDHPIAYAEILQNTHSYKMALQTLIKMVESEIN